tara:strand:- start:2134 stop:2448 length:315 start_codon:yes stop_codon:yes gene_type:complete
MTDKPMPVVILEWKPLERNTLRGFAKIKLGALKIHDVAVHTKGDRSWAQLPAKPQMNADGTARRNNDGKMQYTPVIEWETREASDRFSASVVAAINQANPGAIG